MMRSTHDIRLHHVALRVAAIERSAAFYRTTLGFEIVKEHHVDGRRVIARLQQPGSSCTLELIEHQPPTVPGDRIHLGLSTPNIAALDARLRQHDAGIWTERIDVGNERILFFRDPDGLLIEANDGLL